MTDLIISKLDGKAIRPLLIASEPQALACTDCACADHPFTLTITSTTTTGAYTQVADAFAADLPNGFHALMSPFAAHGPSVVNAAGWERWSSFATPQPIAYAFDQQLVEQGLIYSGDAAPALQDLQPGTLTAWLHVSNACNLDCPYCYVRKSSAVMSNEIGSEAIRRLCTTAASKGMHSLKLKYAGGEASLQFGLVRTLHAQAVKWTQVYGIALHEVLLTNGVQLRQTDADWCRAERVNLMVSVDGVGAMHDQLRPWRNGRESFAAVQRTVDDVLLPRNLRPDISMTVTSLNADGAADLVNWAMLERGLPLNFNFYRANARVASHSTVAFEETRIIAGLLAAYQVIEAHLPSAPFLNGLLDRGQAYAHRYTCGAGRNYVVIDHTGRIAQCQMHMDSTVQWPEHGDIFSSTTQGSIINLSVDEKEGCRTCTFRYRCTGGCPLETFRATGRWDVQSPNCTIYRSLWPAALRLEGLRLMQVNGLLN